MQSNQVPHPILKNCSNCVLRSPQVVYEVRSQKSQVQVQAEIFLKTAGGVGVAVKVKTEAHLKFLVLKLRQQDKWLENTNCTN